MFICYPGDVSKNIILTIKIAKYIYGPAIKSSAIPQANIFLILLTSLNFTEFSVIKNSHEKYILSSVSITLKNSLIIIKCVETVMKILIIEKKLSCIHLLLNVFPIY